MTEDPEQLASDWQQRQHIDHTDWSYKGYILALGIVFLAAAIYFAVLMTVRARAHNVDLWLINGVNRLTAIFLVCVSLWGGYRRIWSTAVGFWSQGQLLLFIKSTFTLMFLQMAIALMLLIMSFLLH